MAVDNFGMMADVNSIENSLGYMSLPQMLTQRIAVANQIALMKVKIITFLYLISKNENGAIVGPTEEYVLLAQQNKTFDQNLFANFFNQPQGWPLVLVGFIAIRTDKTQNCSQMRELFNFIHWTKVAPEALSHNVPSGYSRWSDHLNNQIIEYLTTATCDGKLILEILYQPQHTGASFPFFLVLSLVLFGIAVILGGVWHYLNQSKCSKVVVMYQCILLVGVGMTYISVIFW